MGLQILETALNKGYYNIILRPLLFEEIDNILIFHLTEEFSLNKCN